MSPLPAFQRIESEWHSSESRRPNIRLNVHQYFSAFDFHRNRRHVSFSGRLQCFAGFQTENPLMGRAFYSGSVNITFGKTGFFVGAEIICGA